MSSVTKLRCTNCGNVFDKKTLTSSSAVGASGFGLGAMALPLVWPLVLRVYAECPACKQKGWLKVLRPGNKS
jgi:rubredoxin